MPGSSHTASVQSLRSQSPAGRWRTAPAPASTSGHGLGVTFVTSACRLRLPQTKESLDGDIERGKPLGRIATEHRRQLGSELGACDAQGFTQLPHGYGREVATRYDYRRQAETYDLTRAASPSVLEPVAAALGPPAGPLLDVGGGTGNYARALASRGWAPVVVDHSSEMLRRAAAKALPVAVGDASRLPLPDRSVGSVTMISMLHHVPDASTALADACRVVRPGGAVAVVAFAREHLDVHWVSRYFPTATAFFHPAHHPLDQLRSALPGAQLVPLHYRDVVDGSMAALCRCPELLLDPNRRRQTSFFEKAAELDPTELEAGLSRLEADLAAGARPQDENPDLRAGIGDASLLVWRRPALSTP